MTTPWKLRFALIFGGQAASLIGSAMTQFVLVWWITDTTGDMSALAIAGVAALLPQALLAPLAGTLADRWSRRRIMIAADLISAACMAVLVALFLTDAVQLWHLYTMMAVRSAMQAFQQPAAMATTPMLVPAHFITRAAGLNQTMMGIMAVAAAPLGALAISAMPIGWALSIDIGTALLGIVPLMFYAIPQDRPPEGASGVWAEFREGFDTVWHDAGLRHIYLLLAAVMVVVMPFFTLVPLLVKDHFGGGPADVALIESLSGIGMILGGLAVTVLSPRRKVLWFLWGWGLSCLTLGLMGLAAPDQIWLATVWWFLSGLTFIAGNAPLNALIALRVPNHLLGRAMSLMQTIFGLSAPVGLAVFTPLGEVIGVAWLFVVMGFGSAAICATGFLSRPIMALDDGALPSGAAEGA